MGCHSFGAEWLVSGCGSSTILAAARPPTPVSASTLPSPPYAPVQIPACSPAAITIEVFTEGSTALDFDLAESSSLTGGADRVEDMAARLNNQEVSGTSTHTPLPSPSRRSALVHAYDSTHARSTHTYDTSPITVMRTSDVPPPRQCPRRASSSRLHMHFPPTAPTACTRSGGGVDSTRERFHTGGEDGLLRHHVRRRGRHPRAARAGLPAAHHPLSLRRAGGRVCAGIV